MYLIAYDSDAPTQVLKPINEEIVETNSNPEKTEKRSWVKVVLITIPFILVMILAFLLVHVSMKITS